jgi:hypothetical protein
METLLYLKSLSLEEVVGHLHPVETRKKPPPMKESEGRLLLTDDEWLARVKTRDGSGGGGNKGKGAKQSTQGGRKMLAGRDDICAYCGKKGHWAKECRKKKHDQEAQAHVA